jgi:elongation factor Ts
VAVTTEDIKRLREITGAGVMECKRALTDAEGDLDRAQVILKEQGALIAAKKAGREASQGLIEAYVHGGRIGALLELNCETDFVARSDDFKQLARDVVMQIAAMDPQAIGDEEDLDSRGIGDEQVLLRQAFIRDPAVTIQDRVNDTVNRVRERIVIRRFTRFVLGD